MEDKVKKKYILLMGCSIIIAALLLMNRQLQIVIPVFAYGTAYNQDIPISVNVKPLITIHIKKNTHTITAKTVKSGHAATIPMESLNSVKNLPQQKLFNYLSAENNRQKVMKGVLKLNNGSIMNGCVYFVAEALRQNGIDIADATSNTSQLLNQLKKKGWTTIIQDYRKLQPGDICFTTDGRGGDGYPSHTYIFMGWASSDNFDYAMVCDNQQSSYGNVYHKRNIIKVERFKGEKKETFRFCIRK